MSNSAQMTKVTAGLASKSEKMRALAKAGYSRSDIARFLGTSYQFVRNVLVREDARHAASHLPVTADAPAIGSERNSNRIRLGPSGQVTIPITILKSLGLKEGDLLIANAEDDEVRLMTIPVAVRKAQALVRQYAPAGISLVDELLEDRRREVESEQGE
ncbi:MAG: AbrB/MazE/SpoVT family DNA-binding domain-containing protein [Pseudolabrys sp.]|jgi:bifunctional DNA-binding transcriptional regulator/antitoxin component of YhaV-PrlF toxin-antitoxin module